MMYTDLRIKGAKRRPTATICLVVTTSSRKTCSFVQTRSKAFAEGGTAGRAMSVEVLSTAAQLYEKFTIEKAYNR